ncbi:hypothetical protein FC10_GL000223 [Lactobacillus delbrueckii subsp. lactis DSM 20072]|nr:hypothetical protein FC10_GL000223 [Lactobacillus delbrueckii subsp. lactis DSM 20072]
MTLAAAIFLKEAGCNLAQGSLFSPPVPLDELYKKNGTLFIGRRKPRKPLVTGLAVLVCQFLLASRASKSYKAD